MREYKIGDWVIYISKEWSDEWETWYGVSLYRKLAKIIDIDKYNICLLEFKEYIDGHGKSQKGHRIWCKKENFKSTNSLKFKKWIGGA